MAGEKELRELLPKMRFNEEFKKRQAYKYKKRVEAREKDMELVSGKKRSAAAKEKELAKKVSAKLGKKSAAEEKSAPKATTALKKKSKTTKKTRTPKLKIASAETGKETLKKKKAREMVAANKKSKSKKATTTTAAAAAPSGAKKSKRTSTAEEAITTSSGVTAGQSASSSSGATSSTTRAGKAAGAPEASPSPPPLLTPSERDRALLAKAIRGDDLLGGEGTASNVDGAAFVRQDPSLYPDLDFLDEYAEKKHAEVVSAEELLENAHHFFKDLGRRERALNHVAKEHIQHLRAVNRRGGDKDGFRYVVPKNVKSVVRNLLASKKAQDGVEDPEALIDPRSLVSTFGGDGVAETSDKPVRRSRRKHNRTYSDFYQFQVSKKWTRNAENFLKRSRPNKMLFESKKHTRSIKNF